MKRRIFAVVSESFYDSTEYSVTSFSFLVRKFNTHQQATRYIKANSESADSMLWVEELEVNSERLQDLEENRYLS